ncbi:MAG: hypothetical protein WC325_00305 [Candidatus Bathyarchaeia archaeon]|jgi:hypothetical protein
MHKNTISIVGAIFVLVGVLIVVHHVAICGRLFDLGDILHHEFFEAITFTAGIVMLITSKTKQKQN